MPTPQEICNKLSPEAYKALTWLYERPYSRLEVKASWSSLRFIPSLYWDRYDYFYYEYASDIDRNRFPDIPENDIRSDEFIHEEEEDVPDSAAAELITHRLVEVDDSHYDHRSYTMTFLGDDVAQCRPSWSQRDPG